MKKNNLREITPQYLMCSGSCCPRIYEGKGKYLIIGKKVDPKEFGLKGKVGEGEVLIKIPKALIDKKEKK